MEKMDKLRQTFIDGKMEIFNDETVYLGDKNKTIMDIYNLVTNATDEISRKNCKNDIYLLMSEYLPLDMCPFMREFLRLQHDFIDSLEEFDEKDLYNIKVANVLLFKALLKHDKEFPSLFAEAVPDSDQDESILEMVRIAKDIIDGKVRLKNYNEYKSGLPEGDRSVFLSIIEENKSNVGSSRVKAKTTARTKKTKSKEEEQINADKISDLQKKIDEKLEQLNKLGKLKTMDTEKEQEQEQEKPKAKRGRKKKE